MNEKTMHIVVAGDDFRSAALDAALMWHLPAYVTDCRRRTRITVPLNCVADVHDFVFEYQELFDNSWWRIVDLTGQSPAIETHRPQYDGLRKDFVDVEWEFVVGGLSHPIFLKKLTRWASDSGQRLLISLNFHSPEKNRSYARKLERSLPGSVTIETAITDPEAKQKRHDALMGMARYLHYFYQASYELNHVPTELPEAEVQKAWEQLDDTLKMSNIYNVMTIPVKMEILGHDRNDWATLYALTAEEIDMLTAVEHNRWSVERLIQGMRPCTDRERAEIEVDLQRRLTDSEYARENPVSLKKKYKTERNAHYDLCAFSELGVDETGLPVTRYDRDLTAAIPLIVKTFNDRHSNE